MLEFVLTAWRSGLRGRSFQAVFILGLVLLGVASLAGGFSPRQPQAVALDVGLSGIRLVTILLVLFWVQELVGREIERRTVLFALTYPLPRWHYLVGRYLGIVSMSAVAVAVLGLGLALMVHYRQWGYQQALPVAVGWPLVVTLLLLWLSIAVVAAFTLCIAAVATTPLLPFALGAGFAIACQAIGPVLAYLARGADGDIKLAARFEPIMAVIKWLIPDLGRLDVRAWPLYGEMPSVELMTGATAMAVAFIGLMLLVAVRAFARREFL